MHSNGNSVLGAMTKGPEPEAIAVGQINGKAYSFIGMERIGGIFIYDVTDPAAAKIVGYKNNRNFDVEAEVNGAPNPAVGDLGPASILFIPAADSPNGRPFGSG